MTFLSLRLGASLAISAGLAAGLLACGGGSDPAVATQTGNLRAAGEPVESVTITLFAAGTETGAGATALGSAQTDANGSFQLAYNAPADANTVLYLVADGPTAEVRLATVLGTGNVPADVTINERTTVATAIAMAQFIDGAEIGGKSPGLQNAAGTFANLVDRGTGDISTFLATSPNGPDTSAMPALNSLANMLAGCVGNPAQCSQLFEQATPPGDAIPTDTLQAAINIAHFPWQNVMQLFGRAQVFELYTPALDSEPNDWTIAIKYIGNGMEFDGPGNIAFDEKGFAWINQNYVFNSDHSLPACGSNLLTYLSPTGQDIAGAPYSGGGLAGAGFGIGVATNGDIWIGNLGFYGMGCTTPPAANSVSQFRADGTPVSPVEGWTQGGISSPQATVSDQAGNIWIANACGASVTQYRGGDPNDFWVFNFGVNASPFDIKFDHDGIGWVTDNGNGELYRIDADGNEVGDRIAGLIRPMGLAIDSQGNVWASNSGIISIPCPDDPEDHPDFGDLTPSSDASVAWYRPDGTSGTGSPFKDTGAMIPWGIACDGNDNVWVADFGGQRVVQICGASLEGCPPGAQPGDAISPLMNGYQSDGLMRNTGVAIDTAGNVWLANNWLQDPIQTNPGGDGAVVFVGLAAPVKTPTIGPVQRP